MMTYAFRAYRWQFLLAGLGPTRFSDAFRTTVIGFAASFLLPARAGEFLRPYLLAQRSGLSATAAFADRGAGAGVRHGRHPDPLRGLPRGRGSGAGAGESGRLSYGAGRRVVGGRRDCGDAAGVLRDGRPSGEDRAYLRPNRTAAARAARAVGRRACRTVCDRPRRGPSARSSCLLVFVWSFPLWMSIGLGIYLVSKAFHIEVSYVDSFVIVTLLAVGVTVPDPGVGGRVPQVLSDRRDVVLPCLDGACRRRGHRAPRGIIRAGHAARHRVHGPGRADAGRNATDGFGSRFGGGGGEMKCPYCGHLGDKVVDSRESKEGEVIRRRRECLDCGRRFTSYERIDENPVHGGQEGREPRAFSNVRS